MSCGRSPDPFVTQFRVRSFACIRCWRRTANAFAGQLAFHNAYFAQWNINSHKFTLDMPGKVRDETIKSCSICFVYMFAKKSYIPSEKKKDTKIIKDHFLTGSTNIFGHFLQWAAGNIELMGSLMQVLDLSRLPPQ